MVDGAGLMAAAGDVAVVGDPLVGDFAALVGGVAPVVGVLPVGVPAPGPADGVELEDGGGGVEVGLGEGASVQV